MTNEQINFKVALKVYPTEGNLAYEYNPFYNYRIDEDMYYYKGALYTAKELMNVKQIYLSDGEWIGCKDEKPIIYQKGQIVDFDTEELHFNLNNPVSITPQWSYDNSVNLIINDGINSPKLINSRFSVTERNKYQVCNRKGNNDTNIYDRGDQFETDTSLYKKMINIPKLYFLGVGSGGNLKIGNYHFYFKYVDEDGNETDFFAESGLVSIFIGNSIPSIHSGFRNENAYKLVKFLISNTDPGYEKVRIYYTKSTSDILENATISAFRIDRDFKITGNNTITITGFEDCTEVPLSDINLKYQQYGSVETQATAQNRLFLANVDKPKIDYEDLQDCALRFLPELDINEEYNETSYDYTSSTLNTYYDPSYIYNKVGYWDNEIYRFGVVFLFQDNTLSDVFNVRGINNLSYEDNSYSDILFYKDNKRNYISYDDINFNIITDNNESNFLENAKGVVKLKVNDKFNKVIGINFKIKNEVLEYLKNTHKIKGFFFVRQKRIPTTLCQAYTIGIDKQSRTPVIPLNGDKYISESFLTQGKKGYYEDTIEEDRLLVNTTRERLYKLDNYEVDVQGAICPEYDVNSPYLNSLFTGGDFVCRTIYSNENLELVDNLQHVVETNNDTPNDYYTNIKIQGVEDNVKLVAIKDVMFSARAGEAEEGFRFEYIGKENKTKSATNLLRGSYGPYLGITGYNKAGDIIEIKIPGYSESNMLDYFKIRYSDKTAYYPISERIDLSKEDWFINITNDNDENYEKKLSQPLYRGDCYICIFTHRLNRNFQDPSSPTNDIIIDSKCWKKNYDITDGIIKKDNFEKINLGDINAVKLGLYVTVRVKSSMNLNIRSIDTSVTDETALTGHPRGFYPYLPMSNSGIYKVPEALCYNKGFEKSVSEKYNFEVPDVPWIKNEFSNRIAYSNIEIRDAFTNGFRTFEGMNYKDYPKTYGSITKIIELGGHLLCVLEHGIYLIPVNERTLQGEGAGGEVFVNTANVLPENPNVISDTYGSQWRESVIKTPKGVYGVDTVGKKIWFVSNQGQFECISDFTIQEFLNKNISLKERELEPIIGIRNVKTHYNNFKGDVMFTFYDNVYDYEEKAWNICWNERMNKWITFYSWIPSYSENIYNQYFSFDRNTSKIIAKLGISKHGNDFSDGITLKTNIIEDSNYYSSLFLDNRTSYNNQTITYYLDNDIYKNYKYFKIENNELRLLTSKELADNKLSFNDLKEKDVIYLNIRAAISFPDTSNLSERDKLYLESINKNISIDAGYYKSTVALIFKDNLENLTTDFWKHGQSGIIDDKEEIKPTHWYGKQHPFEFEFIISENPQNHKIFDNLKIISNNAEPESFHYEIIGDCFNFNKQNIYIRQEATRELYQNNGCDVEFDHDYVTLKETRKKVNDNLYDKSILFPTYYSRKNGINEIEDYYYAKDGSPNKKNFANLAGGEILRNTTTKEYSIWNHAKAVDMTKQGRLRGNMYYKEDIWNVQINPLVFIEKNEPNWENCSILDGSENKIPVEINQSPIPDEVLSNEELVIPESFDKPKRGITEWANTKRSEVKIKDKYIKIRIRYSGDKLAIINAIQTLYSISYS